MEMIAVFRSFISFYSKNKSNLPRIDGEQPEVSVVSKNFLKIVKSSQTESIFVWPSLENRRTEGF